MDPAMVNRENKGVEIVRDGKKYILNRKRGDKQSKG